MSDNSNTVKQGLALILSVLVVVSAIPLGAGIASAQEGLNDKNKVEKCNDNLSQLGVNTVIIGLYECIGGAFSPADYGSSPELMTQAWTSAVSIQDSAENRRQAYNNWGEMSKSYALQKAEQPVIEAHYDSADKATSLSEGSDVVMQYYSVQMSAEYSYRTDLIERAFQISKSTRKDDDIETVVGWRFNGEGGIDYINGSVTEGAEIIYEERVLPNGEKMEVPVAIHGFSTSEGGNAIVFDTEYASENGADFSIGVEHGPVPVTYDEETGEYSSLGSFHSGELYLNDPYGSEVRHISAVYNSMNRIDEMKSEQETAMGELETMVNDLYSNYETGTIDPSEYVSAATLTEKYAGEDSSYGYATAVATVNGMTTDLQSEMEYTFKGEDRTGSVLLENEGNALADAGAQAYIDRNSSILSFESSSTDSDSSDSESSSAQDTVTFDGKTITNVGLVADDAYSISDDGSTVTIDEDGLVNEYVLFEFASADSTTNAQTVVMYASEAAAQSGIPSGLQTGTEYDTGNIDGTVMFTYNSGNQAQAESVSGSETFTINSATDTESGAQMEYIVYDDSGQRSFTETSNLTEEMERIQDIIDSIESGNSVVEDPDPAGSGGGSGFTDGIMWGVAVVLVFLAIVIILALLGRITTIT